MNNGNYSKEVKRQVVDYYNTHRSSSARVIANKFGVSKNSVYRWVKRINSEHGHTAPAPCSSVSEDEIRILKDKIRLMEDAWKKFTEPNVNSHVADFSSLDSIKRIYADHGYELVAEYPLSVIYKKGIDNDTYCVKITSPNADNGFKWLLEAGLMSDDGGCKNWSFKNEFKSPVALKTHYNHWFWNMKTFAREE